MWSCRAGVKEEDNREDVVNEDKQRVGVYRKRLEIGDGGK